IDIVGAIGFDTALPATTTPVSSLDKATDPFFNGDTNHNNNVFSANSTLVESANLELIKTAAPDPVIGGGEITYTFTVFNHGPSASAGFKVVDPLPASLEYVGGLSGAGWAQGAIIGNTVSVDYTGPALAKDQSSSFSFKAKANIGSGTVTNTASVEAGATPDTVPNNNTAEVNTDVTAGADVRISKSASPTPAISGQPITFTVVVTNDGPSPAANVAFADAMPAGFVITGGNQPAGWTCSTDAGDTTRSCQIPSLASGASTTFTIDATVPSTGVNSSGDVTNTVDVTSDTQDPNAGNNSASTTFTVLPDGADLQLDSKAKVPALVAIWKPGDGTEVGRMTSTIKLSNKGPRDATGNVQVVDALAAGEAFVQSDSPAWSCSAVPVVYTPGTPQVVTCDLLGITPASPLAVGAQAPDLVLVTRAMAASANLTNRACTGGSGGSVEPNTGSLDLDRNEDNDCRDGDGVRTTDERADLRISKTATTANGDKVLNQTEDTVTYTLTVTNDGPDATAGVVINDQIPGYLAGTAIATDTTLAPGFSCQVSAASVVCRSQDNVLASGVSATIVITAKRGLYDSIGQASQNCGGETVANAWCNTASIGIEAQYAGAVGEVNTGNNRDSDWVRVEPVTNVQTQSKTVAPAAGQIGVDTTYSMAYRNNGPSKAVGVVFRDVFTLDAGDAGFVLR
ncbi:MAG TPA: DUF11 domain-containing protein, partial [Rhodanobacter sp.]|nr:DUF11 domain-containing protein [Rhodanobacter sp.]